jgi:hypothetical protein
LCLEVSKFLYAKLNQTVTMRDIKENKQSKIITLGISEKGAVLLTVQYFAFSQYDLSHRSFY